MQTARAKPSTLQMVNSKAKHTGGEDKYTEDGGGEAKHAADGEGGKGESKHAADGKGDRGEAEHAADRESEAKHAVRGVKHAARVIFSGITEAQDAVWQKVAAG